MPLACIDRILELEEGKRIVTQKAVGTNEEFFKDHFEGLSVYPGVLILEGMIQSASWMIRSREKFNRSQILMTHCSQVKYTQLVQPGTVLTFEAELVSVQGTEYGFKGKATQDGQAVATAQFKLRSQSIGEIREHFGHLEGSINTKAEQQFHLLRSFGEGKRGLKT